MKWSDILNETSHRSTVNWVRPDLQNLEMEYKYEYMLTSRRTWDKRCKTIGAVYPIFDSFEDFAEKISSAPIQIITPSTPIHNMTQFETMDDARKELARDVDRIIHGFDNGVKIPLPIIIKGNDGMWLLSGNTRSNLAFIHNVTLKAIVYDGSRHEVE